MNILYLHGLKSKLSPEKKKILEQYGKVYAPDIDYESRYIQPVEILKQYPKIEFNAVTGSSMGALNAYIISENIGRSALMFNPPLAKYEAREFKARFTKGYIYQQFRLGGKDEVVSPIETMNFLSSKIRIHDVTVNIDPNLGHRIPPELLNQDLQRFFSELCY